MTYVSDDDYPLPGGQNIPLAGRSPRSEKEDAESAEEEAFTEDELRGIRSWFLGEGQA